MAFPCSGCDGCGDHTDQPFQADNSSTLVHVTCASETFFECKDCAENTATCGISQAYMEGSSWKASVVEDVVYLGGDASFTDETLRNQYGTHFQFGCQRSETGLFITQVADGIMGLSNSDDHIVAKLYRENKIPSNLFALCFSDLGGSMALGQPNKIAHRGEISYAKVISDRSSSHFYNVRMKDIRIGGKSIEADETAYTRGHFIVDSGTTDSYLPRALKNEFQKVFEEVAGHAYEVSGAKCSGFTEADLATLPTIQFVMEAFDGGEVTLDITPDQYLLHSDGAFCGNIFLSEHAGGVIGANIMMNRDVIFDGGNQRVGFVDADCSYQKPATAAPKHDDANATASAEGEENNVVPTTTPVAPPTEVVTLEETPAPTTAQTPTPTATSTPESTIAETASVIEPTEEVTVESTVAPTSEVPVATIDTATKQDDSGKSDGGNDAHPIVLTLVGAVLVVGFLVMMLISVSRRKQSGKSQNWSRVKDTEEDVDDDDDDDEEEFGLVKASTKHQRLANTDEDTGGRSSHGRHAQESSDEEDEIFDRKSLPQEETKVDPRTLERL
ncbi:hypothetical protein BBJ28_00006818 [Nothophytophthora sp. Chile5]|nr:hypothetical protein BBJ28_00006818 [Nothophytophthora sp. Chile5]